MIHQIFDQVSHLINGFCQHCPFLLPCVFYPWLVVIVNQNSAHSSQRILQSTLAFFLRYILWFVHLVFLVTAACLPYVSLFCLFHLKHIVVTVRKTVIQKVFSPACRLIIQERTCPVPASTAPRASAGTARGHAPAWYLSTWSSRMKWENLVKTLKYSP